MRAKCTAGSMSGVAKVSSQQRQLEKQSKAELFPVNLGSQESESQWEGERGLCYGLSEATPAQTRALGVLERPTTPAHGWHVLRSCRFPYRPDF